MVSEMAHLSTNDLPSRPELVFIRPLSLHKSNPRRNRFEPSSRAVLLEGIKREIESSPTVLCFFEFVNEKLSFRASTRVWWLSIRVVWTERKERLDERAQAMQVKDIVPG